MDLLDALATPAGGELLAVAGRALAAGRELPVGERLRSDGQPAELVAAAFGQAELRIRAAAKFSRAAGMLFTRDGLEQASSEPVARHRAGRFAGVDRLADLCTGIGGDLALLASRPGGLGCVAVDLDEAHLRMARHNAGVYGAPDGSVEAVRGDARDVDLAGIGAVFVDPARRAGGRRLRTGDGSPPLDWCFALAERVPAVGIKAAPGLPREIVPAGWEVEFVADGRDLKEAVLYAPALASARRRATVLSGGRVDTLVAEPDGSDGPLPVGEPGEFLYDPSPAVTRAALVGELGRRLGARQIDERIAFLTGEVYVPTPFARGLRISHSLPFDVRALARLLRSCDVGALDVRRRGLAGDVDAIRRRLLPPAAGRSGGGPALVVVMTRKEDRPWAFVCAEVDA
jgi:THUMP domain-like/RNA cap guanine-N2 methyltransferase